MSLTLKREIGRKTFHVSSLLIPFVFRYFFHNNRKEAFVFLVPLALLAVFIDYLRLYNKDVKKIFLQTVGSLLREHELENLSGASYLMISAVIAIAFFPVDITFTALAFLAIGDTLAALVGINFGSRKLMGTKKSLEGSLACFISTFVFALFFVHPVVAVVGAIATTFAEFYPMGFDDNIKIPLISGVAMTIVNMFV